jgi:TPR repeat protein
VRLPAETPSAEPRATLSGRAVQAGKPNPTILAKAKAGDPAAQTALGNAYEFGQGASQYYEGAVLRYRQEADQGNADAGAVWADLEALGNNVPLDHAQAAMWYRKAADQGYALAQFNLGLLYDWGHGVPQDKAQAAEWFRKSANQGYAPAQLDLGEAYNLNYAHTSASPGGAD